MSMIAATFTIAVGVGLGVLVATVAYDEYLTWRTGALADACWYPEDPK